MSGFNSFCAHILFPLPLHGCLKINNKRKDNTIYRHRWQLDHQGLAHGRRRAGAEKNTGHEWPGAGRLGQADGPDLAAPVSSTNHYIMLCFPIYTTENHHSYTCGLAIPKIYSLPINSGDYIQVYSILASTEHQLLPWVAVSVREWGCMGRSWTCFFPQLQHLITTNPGHKWPGQVATNSIASGQPTHWTLPRSRLLLIPLRTRTLVSYNWIGKTYSTKGTLEKLVY